MRKLTQSDFINKVEKLHPNLDFSQFVYQGHDYKSIVICKHHGPYEVKANALINGISCKKCWDERRGGHFAMLFEEFKEKASEVHSCKYEYPEQTWVGVSSKVRIICKDHGGFIQYADNHLKGQGCKKCAALAKGLSKKLSQSEVIKRLESVFGSRYDYSKVEYKTSKDKITIICNEHGEFQSNAGNLMRGHGCPSCGKKEIGMKSRLTEAQWVKKFRETHGDNFAYGKVFYKDSKCFVEVICEKHGMFEQFAFDHAKGIGCKKCSYNVYDTESFISESIKVHGNKYDYSKVNYTNAHAKVVVTCKEHGDFEIGATYHVNNEQGCAKCANHGPSKQQLELNEFIKQFCETELDYKLPSGKHIDVYIPTMKLGFEYQGSIWHSTKFAKDKFNINTKRLECEKEGIRVISIFEDEWLHKNKIVKNAILAILGKLDRLNARDCDFINVEASVAESFLNNNHLQGFAKGCKNYGLTHNNELVAIMSFSRVNSIRGFQNDNKTCELRRFASSKQIVGGASKLLKNFIRSNRSIEKIISYSDTRFHTGNMYAKLGFTLEKESEPDYYYVDNKRNRFSKIEFQRKFLESKLGSDFDPALSEVANCRKAGYYQLFDCGKKKWVLVL